MQSDKKKNLSRNIKNLSVYTEKIKKWSPDKTIIEATSAEAIKFLTALWFVWKDNKVYDEITFINKYWTASNIFS